MLLNMKDILIKLSFIILFIFFFQETIYAKEYFVNDCVVIFSDDWVKRELNNNQYAQDSQYKQLVLINKKRHEMASIFAVPQSTDSTDISKLENTESWRNAFVQTITKKIKEVNAEKILFSEYRNINSIGAVYTEYLNKEKESNRLLYVREYNIIKNEALYTFSFIYPLEDDFTRGAEYDKQIVNNIKFYDKPADSLKDKLQQNLDNLVDDARQQQKREDDARLYAFLHGGFKAAIYTAIFIGIAFFCKKFFK